MPAYPIYPYRPNAVLTLQDYQCLSEGTMYRHDYAPSKLNKPIESIVRKIDLGLSRGRNGTNLAALRYIISNALLSLQKGYWGFRINVSNNSYKSDVLPGRKGFCTVADALVAQGYLHKIPGRTFQGKSYSGFESEDVRNFSTSYLLTAKFIRVIEDQIESYSVPRSFVQVLDRETDEPIKKKDASFTNFLKSNVRQERIDTRAEERTI